MNFPISIMTLGRIPAEAQPTILSSPMRAAQLWPAAGRVGPLAEFPYRI
jgi:hypothetical protein